MEGSWVGNGAILGGWVAEGVGAVIMVEDDAPPDSVVLSPPPAAAALLLVFTAVALLGSERVKIRIKEMITTQAMPMALPKAPKNCLAYRKHGS